jgi:hypothetical protein
MSAGLPPTHIRQRLPRRVVALVVAAILTTLALIAVVGQRSATPSRGTLPLEVRAELELRDAEKATQRGELDRAGAALKAAMDTLDLRLSEAPGDAAATRAWLAAADRAVEVALRRGHPEAALVLLTRGAERANELLDAQRSDTRAVLDAVAMTNKLVDALERAGGQRALARMRLEELTSRLEPSAIEGEATLAAAARSWLRLAGMHAGEQAKAALERAWSAAEKAWSSGATSGDAAEADAVFDAAVAHARRTNDAAGAFTLEKRAVAWHARRAATAGPNMDAQRALESRGLEAADTARAAGDATQARAWLDAAVGPRRARWAAAQGEAKANAALDLARALSGLGAHHTATGALVEAEAAHAEAVRVAEALTGPARRTLHTALGNWAQALARIEQVDRARAAAERSNGVAQQLASSPGVGLEARLDVSVAGLRWARLLRAEPAPDRARALTVATAALAALPALDNERARSTRAGLEALLAELAPTGAKPSGR